MGFLDGLTTLLGGFSDVKQIDEDGFDFREKRIAAQQARDQAREDWATKAATEASLGTEDDSVLGATIPTDVNRARVMARAKGAGLQSKSALAQQKAFMDAQLLAQKGEQAEKQIALRGDEAESLARVRAALVAGQQPSERDRFIAEEAAKRTGMSVDGLLQRARMSAGRSGGKPQLRQNASGEWVWIYPPGSGGDGGADTGGATDMASGGGGPGVVGTGVRAPLGVTARESQVTGTGALASIAALENLMKENEGSEGWFGKGASLGYKAKTGALPGPAGYISEALTEPPSSEQALAYSIVGSLKNQGIRAITGAQMSEKEVPRILQEIPTEQDRGPVFWAKMAATKARFELLDAVRSGRISREEAIDQINSIGPEHYLQQYRDQGLTSGGQPPRVTNEEEYNRLPPGTLYIDPNGKRKRKGGR